MNVLEILQNFYEKMETIDLALLFDQYMHEIGAKRLDRRRKDTSNTYVIDGDSANWNRVDCTYYKNSGDYIQYGKFAFCITFRERRGDYLLIEVGSPSGEIKRLYERKSFEKYSDHFDDVSYLRWFSFRGIGKICR